MIVGAIIPVNSGFYQVVSPATYTKITNACLTSTQFEGDIIVSAVSDGALYPVCLLNSSIPTAQFNLSFIPGEIMAFAVTHEEEDFEETHLSVSITGYGEPVEDDTPEEIVEFLNEADVFEPNFVSIDEMQDLDAHIDFVEFYQSLMSEVNNAEAISEEEEENEEEESIFDDGDHEDVHEDELLREEEELEKERVIQEEDEKRQHEKKLKVHKKKNNDEKSKKERKWIRNGSYLKMMDLEVGNGETLKKGDRAVVEYCGKLKKTGQIFDESSGKPFKFRFGAGEVIKGWDMGLQGMKVGGVRRLEIKPKLGYGSQRSGPIPPNSTLWFDIELVSIKH
eukprot:TRINITY_DN10386_c0_g1_i1.p1 TRINITY_DN10386_c0_g1~~TRINITY_DN10386_c0_g1_i1.p1  ORF type:complete len:349 (+),score=148.11 TRINITY_DN10386_c0_g1_i1:39-1049(+)